MSKRSECRLIGETSVYFAIIWLRNHDYDVFENVCHWGPIDLVAIRGTEILLIDVKSVKLREDRREMSPYYTMKENQKSLGVKFLYVTDDGFCAFDPRVIKEHLCR